MTNKTMLSVERELLERILDSIGFGEREELKAILDKDDAQEQQDDLENLAEQLFNRLNPGCKWWKMGDDIKDRYRAEPVGPVAGHCTHPAGCKSCSWCGFKVEKGSPVEYWYVGDLDGYGCLYTTPDADGLKLYSEQPEPAADHPQCEECKGWGYHENHHEGSGTECGECGGSGNATVAVAVVMHELSGEEVEFIKAVQASRGGKIVNIWKAGGEAIWPRLEEIGLIKCLGGYKWELTFDAVDMGIKARLNGVKT